MRIRHQKLQTTPTVKIFRIFYPQVVEGGRVSGGGEILVIGWFILEPYKL